jgi:hypothetical protein
MTVETALFWTVWAAVVLFVAAEAGKSGTPASGSRWPLLASFAGAALLAVHMAIAMDVRHAWEHSSVVRTISEQSRAVYGVGWNGGVWMNYLFLGLWTGETSWWAAAPRSYADRPRWFIVLTRAFYALMLVNAAVVFAAPSRRPAGAALMAVLFWHWRHTLRGARQHTHAAFGARI